MLEGTVKCADLADKGIYIAAESTFYRVLRRHGELHHRGRQQRPKRVPAPTTFTASAPCQVWVWDITWLPSVVPRALVLSVYDTGYLQPENHRI